VVFLQLVLSYCVVSVLWVQALPVPLFVHIWCDNNNDNNTKFHLHRYAAYDTDKIIKE